MTFIIIDGSKPQVGELRHLKQSLVQSFDTVQTINRQLDEMTDQEASDQFGVPLGDITVFRTNVDNLLATLQSQSVTNIISSIGFDR